MNEARLARFLQANSLVYLLLAALLLLSSWNSLFDSLELPKPMPALVAQVGGGLVIGLAYLLWAGARAPALQVYLLRAALISNVLGAVSLASWLLFRELDRWGVDTLGYTILTALAILLTALAVGAAALSFRAQT